MKVKIYIDSNGHVQSTFAENTHICDEIVGAGNWLIVDRGVWIAAQGNNDNKILDGVLVLNHVPDQTYWLNCEEHTLVFPNTLPKGAVLDKPTDISAREERELRDKLLSLSDWAVLPDAPLTDAQKQEWQAYRQALRDIPQQAGFPTQVTIPEEPAKAVV